MGHVHTKVAAVLNFVDTVTERPVRYRGLQIQIAQQNKVIWKDMDCAVILEQDGADSVDVLISGKYYQEVRLHMELIPSIPPQMYAIWLLPSVCYPFRDDMTIIRGTCFRNDLYVLWPADSAKCKLTEATVVGSDCISLWGIGGSVAGRMLVLYEECENEDSEGGCRWEFVTLLGRTERGTHTYRTKECMRHVFHRGKAKLFKAAKVYIDHNGSFFMAFHREAQNNREVLFWNGDRIVATLQTGEEREYFVAIL